MSKLKELSILPIKSKFDLNDLVLFYKIINSLVPINLPEHFTIIKPENVRLTKNTATILDDKDGLALSVILNPYVIALEIVSITDQWNFETLFHIVLDNNQLLLDSNLEFLLYADLDWPD